MLFSKKFFYADYHSKCPNQFPHNSAMVCTNPPCGGNPLPHMQKNLTLILKNLKDIHQQMCLGPLKKKIITGFFLSNTILNLILLHSKSDIWNSVFGHLGKKWIMIGTQYDLFLYIFSKVYFDWIPVIILFSPKCQNIWFQMSDLEQNWNRFMTTFGRKFQNHVS